MMNKSSSGVLGRNILGNLGSSGANSASAKNNIVKDGTLSNINIPLSLRKCASNGFLASTDDSSDRDDCKSVSHRGDEDQNKLNSNSKRLNSLGKSPINKFKLNLFSEDKTCKENVE